MQAPNILVPSGVSAGGGTQLRARGGCMYVLVYLPATDEVKWQQGN